MLNVEEFRTGQVSVPVDDADDLPFLLAFPVITCLARNFRWVKGSPIFAVDIF